MIGMFFVKIKLPVIPNRQVKLSLTAIVIANKKRATYF